MSPQRIQRTRMKGWRMPDGAVYVGRPTRWGNPFVVGEGQVSANGMMLGPCAGYCDADDLRMYDLPLTEGITAEQAVALYRCDLTETLANERGDELRADLNAELRGRDLVCWCALDQACHADVLLEIANAA